MTQALVAENLSKRYRLGQLHRTGSFRESLVNFLTRKSEPDKELWAVKDVSFSVDRGEVVGIIGHNGAGKSTLLKLISRITRPTTGSMRVRGRLASLLEVGTGFHQELTGRENVYLNGSILGMSKREVDQKFAEIVEFAEVEKFLDTPIKRYSSGMRLRLGFAVAAHLDPDVLLVDEVLAVGDAAFQKKCLGAMEDLQKGERTVLFVSHNMSAVENLCSRVIWLDQGKLREDGPATEVVRNYLNTFGGMTGTGFDLSEAERSGTGGIRINRLDYLTPEGVPTKLIRSGEGLKVRIGYEAFERVTEPHFGLQLMSALGTLITDMSTWHSALEIPVVEPGPGYLELDIPSLNLMPGRYPIGLWASNTRQVDFDLLPHCAFLDVDETDVFETGRGVDHNTGLIYFPARWSHQRLSAAESV